MDGQLPIDIYTRQSHKGDERALSIDGQEAVCRDVLADRDLPLGKVFSDPGKSAWNPRVTRPDWERMMKRLESGISGGVCIFDLERFARRHEDAMRLHKAAEHGLLILDSESAYDLSTPNGLRDFWNAVNAAAYYSGNLSRKVKRGKKLKAKRGQVDGKRCFGFEDDGVTQVPAECDMIRDHAKRLLAGETQQDLIAELHEQGMLTVNGAEWSYSAYRNIMTRKRNIGQIVYKGEVMPGVKLPGDPILDERTHARLVAMYARRRWGRPPSGKYLLTGFTVCGLCGGTMSGRPTASGRKQYWCRFCHRVMVAADHLDEWAGDLVVKILADPAHAEAVAEADAELEAARQALKLEQAQNESVMLEISQRVGRGEMSLARHDAICGPLEARQAEIVTELAQLVAEPAPVPRGRTIPVPDARYVGILADWTDGTPAARRDMVARALGSSRIVVGPATRMGPGFDESRVTVG